MWKPRQFLGLEVQGVALCLTDRRMDQGLVPHEGRGQDLHHLIHQVCGDPVEEHALLEMQGFGVFGLSLGRRQLGPIPAQAVCESDVLLLAELLEVLGGLGGRLGPDSPVATPVKVTTMGPITAGRNQRNLLFLVSSVNSSDPSSPFVWVPVKVSLIESASHILFSNSVKTKLACW